MIVGNFEPEKIKPWVAQYIGGLPGTNRKEKPKDLGIEAPSGIVKQQVKAGSDPKRKSPESRLKVDAFFFILRPNSALATRQSRAAFIRGCCLK